MRYVFLLLISSIAISSISLPILFTTSDTSTVTVAASADSFVSSGRPNACYGADPYLVASNDGYVSYLRFDVPTLNGAVERATLRVYALRDTAKGFNVHRVSDMTWGELEINSATAPGYESPVIANSGDLTVEQWIEVDITEIVLEAGQFSIALVSASSADSFLASREDASFAPQLIIETSSTEPPEGPPESTPAPSPTPTEAPPASDTVFVNAGGGDYVDANGRIWMSDRGYVGGETYSFANYVSKTEDDALHQTQRHGGSFVYAFDVPDGHYDVTLSFVEWHWTVPGQRVFDVRIENQQVLDDFDILAEASKHTALNKQFRVEVADGTVNISFTASQDMAAISAIAISPAGPADSDPPPSPSPEPGPSPTPNPSPSPEPRHGSGPNAVAAGQMKLTSTFNSIGIEVFFTGDDNKNAVANLEFKRSGDSTWRQGLPLWGTYANPRAFYGSALLLEAGTTYDIRISFNDPDGVNGDFSVSGSIATRAENIPAASSLSPTHYVDAVNGKDANSGTSRSNAWKTLGKAFKSAPSGAVVQVAPGSYAPPTSKRTAPVTLVAQFAAVDDARNPINAGNRSVIEYPNSVTSPGDRAWQSVVLKGPGSGNSYTVWKLADVAAGRVAVSDTRYGVPQTVARWAKKSGSRSGYTLQTPAGWAEVVHENSTYRYGFATYGGDTYIRLPGDQDPNDVFVSFGGGALTLNGPDIRVSGFELRMNGIEVKAGATNGVIDHNLIYNANVHYRGSEPSTYPANHVVQYNRMIATSLWDETGGGIPWKFIKGAVGIPGVSGSWSRVGEKEELTAIVGRGGARQLVVRHNTIEGYFNGVGGYNADYDRHSQQDTDIHNNMFRYIADDAFEPEQHAINWRIWSNRIEDTVVGLSTGPVNFGPIYLFRNEFWRLGNHGVAGPAWDPTNPGNSGKGFKYSGSSNVPARIFVINNTFWTDQPDVSGGSQSAGGGANQEKFYLRNNIFVMTRYVFEFAGWDEDYNYFMTSDPGRGLDRHLTIAAYRSATGHGAHSNVSGDLHTAPGLANPDAGSLRLPAGSPLVDAGVVVPNIAEVYGGSAPDLGATER